MEKIGEGGMGEVYLAEDTSFGRRVAIKYLPEKYFDNTQAKEHFQREARTASALNSPHIYTIFVIGEHECQPLILMEDPEGKYMSRCGC